jgi:hypothetical protein
VVSDESNEGTGEDVTDRGMMKWMMKETEVNDGTSERQGTVSG